MCNNERRASADASAVRVSNVLGQLWWSAGMHAMVLACRADSIMAAAAAAAAGRDRMVRHRQPSGGVGVRRTGGAGHPLGLNGSRAT
eukprot:scaffold196669_cov28-Tisochrysis_lutea.AAC.5